MGAGRTHCLSPLWGKSPTLTLQGMQRNMADHQPKYVRAELHLHQVQARQKDFVSIVLGWQRHRSWNSACRSTGPHRSRGNVDRQSFPHHVLPETRRPAWVHRSCPQLATGCSGISHHSFSQCEWSARFLSSGSKGQVRIEKLFCMAFMVVVFIFLILCIDGQIGKIMH